jgi:hypothetical protein
LTRERIVRAAERYLEIGKTSATSWVGTSRCSSKDFAAFRALPLLHRQNPAAYARLAPAVWRKWAPAIAALPRMADDNSDEQVIVGDALEKVPAEAAQPRCTVELTL